MNDNKNKPIKIKFLKIERESPRTRGFPESMLLLESAISSFILLLIFFFDQSFRERGREGAEAALTKLHVD